MFSLCLVLSLQDVRFSLIVCAGCLYLWPMFGSVASNGTTSTSYQIEYYKSVQMNCEFDHTETVVIQKVYMWILPNGQILRPGDVGNMENHISLKNNGMALEIDRIDDEHFGRYMCIVDVGSDIKVIQRGLNVDGPYYGPEHYEKFKHNAMIGGICAGAVLVLLISIWIGHNLYHKSNRTVSSKDIKDMEAGVKEPHHSDVKLDDNVENAIETRQDELDHLEKIYDMADGIDKHKLQSNHTEMNDAVIERSEYHTITEVDATSGNDSTVDTSELVNNYKNDKITAKDEQENSMDTQTNATHGDDIQSNSKKESQVQPKSFLSGDTEEPVYAVPLKKGQRCETPEQVVIIEGEVIIEDSGATIPVTSSSPSPSVPSVTEDTMSDILSSTDTAVTSHSETLNMHTDILSLENGENIANDIAEHPGNENISTLSDKFESSNILSDQASIITDTKIIVDQDSITDTNNLQVVRM